MLIPIEILQVIQMLTINKDNLNTNYLNKHKLEINNFIDELIDLINSNFLNKNFSEAWTNLAKLKFYNNHLNQIEKYILL